MFFRIFQYVGLIVIITFSAISVFLATTERDFKMAGEDTTLQSGYASFFEDRFFDLRMKLTLNLNKQDDRIILAAIDDESLNKIGRWPWSRVKHAEIIDKLNIFGAKIIAFDVFFPEPEFACNAESPDKVFVQSIKRFQADPTRKIILPFSVEEKTSEKINEQMYFAEFPEQLFDYILRSNSNKGANLQESIISKKVFPIPELANSGAGLAHIEANADSDGVFRHYPVVTNITSTYFPSIGLMAYQNYTNDKNIELNITTPDSAVLKTSKGNAYVNSKGELKVRWLGGHGNFPVVSIYDILTAKNDDPKMLDIFKNKIVFIASTSLGAHDLRNTPIDAMLPGVFFHINMTHMLLDGNFFVEEETSTSYTWTLLIIGSLLMVSVMILGNAILDFLVLNIILISFLALDIYYLIPHGYNIRLFFCLFSVVVCYSWSTFLHFYQSNKDKAKIKGTFSRYLAPSIVNDLLKNPEKVKLGGERKNITVFFSDVRDFTSISEKLTPEQLSYVINKYMTMMTDTLFEHKGTLDKYIGDAMVAYWGAPVELENHPYWAIKGAVAMIERLPMVNEEFKKDGFPEFKHGIGLNTGDCSVGNMGSNQIFSYTALGDSMNLGARLESLCKFYGVQINISEFTKNAIPPELQKEFIFRTLDKVKVKGKENAVTIYEVIHPSHYLSNDLKSLKQYEIAFENYLQKSFNAASVILKLLKEKYPEDKTFKRMFEICENFIEVPPPADWDGTYTHLSK